MSEKKVTLPFNDHADVDQSLIAATIAIELKANSLHTVFRIFALVNPNVTVAFIDDKPSYIRIENDDTGRAFSIAINNYL